MRHRKLGRTGFDVSEVGFGAWGISGAQWIGASEHQSLLALRTAIEQGVDFIDTALAYGEGVSERLVGEVVRGSGGRVRVATKVPPKNRLWPARPGIGIEEVFPYDYIMASAEESLRNLRLDSIDLLQLHVWNPAWLNDEDWRKAFSQLKASGKVRAVGVSINDHQPDSALGIIETGLIDSVQVIYNIFDQTPEKNLFPLCRKMQVGVLARVPLDEGGLTGAITEDTRFEPGEFRESYFRGDRKRQVVEHVEALKRDLKDVPGTLPQIAIRFCLSNKAVTSVIPGMRRVQTVESNCRAASAGMLDDKTLAILRRHAWDRNFYE